MRKLSLLILGAAIGAGGATMVSDQPAVGHERGCRLG
ncbi:hypothetical protein MicloDRAFT_00002510 [Microvirga lotononidis]|uniref:Uncharacterized protein n=1 Tax=Microvirga lotononidis TaxID=864069 RepID=I4Z4W9_9HYPH|nr:hypothetical protein MicloDRAFT_00002510 [Microvirga lotononidis]